MSWLRRAPLVVLSLAIALSGCVQEQRYVVEDAEVTMRESAQPIFVDQNGDALFLVQHRYTFPITPPPNGYDFNAGIDDPSPFPRGPWVYVDDVIYQLDWALINRSKRSVEARLVVDGINEFFEYAPGPLNFHQYEDLRALAPGERVSGTVRDLEMREIAVDLATVVNGAPNSDQIVFAQSHSQTDKANQKYIPKIIPGLVGLHVGIQTTEAAHIVLKLTVRATDLGGRIAKRGERTWQLPDPTPFVPIVPEP